MGAENRIDITPGMRQDDTKAAGATIVVGSALLPGPKWTLRGAGTGNEPVIVAGTAPERGKGVGDSYVTDETLRAFYVPMGCVAQFVLAVSQTVTLGDDLAFAANGQVTQSSTNARLVAEEAVTTGAGATALIKATPKQS